MIGLAEYIYQFIHNFHGLEYPVLVAMQNENGIYPDSKVHGANMGPIWGRQDPGGPRVGHMNFVIWVLLYIWAQYRFVCHLYPTHVHSLLAYVKLKETVQWCHMRLWCTKSSASGLFVIARQSPHHLPFVRWIQMHTYIMTTSWTFGTLQCMNFLKKSHFACCSFINLQGPSLLIWINCNPNMWK